jgi:hypothetical protein
MTKHFQKIEGGFKKITYCMSCKKKMMNRDLYYCEECSKRK